MNPRLWEISRRSGLEWASPGSPALPARCSPVRSCRPAQVHCRASDTPRENGAGEGSRGHQAGQPLGAASRTSHHRPRVYGNCKTFWTQSGRVCETLGAAGGQTAWSR